MALGLVVALLAVTMPATAIAPISESSYAETRLWTFEHQDPAGSRAERGLSRTGIEGYQLSSWKPRRAVPFTRGGQQVALHNYYPFGQEATNAGADEIGLKFTGHERDKTGTGSRSELDYMHARHCSPVVGRFLSIDPVNGTAPIPQSWNRYSYVVNNPLNLVDPDGLDPECVTQTSEDGSQTVICGERIDVVDSAEGGDGESSVDVFPTLLAFIEVSSRPDPAPLALHDRALASLPIDGVDYSRCVRKNRINAGAVVFGSAFPKRLLPPFRVPKATDPLTNPGRALVGSPLKRAFPNSAVARSASGAVRAGGRAVSFVATPATVFVGYYNIGTLANCAF